MNYNYNALKEMSNFVECTFNLHVCIIHFITEIGSTLGGLFGSSDKKDNTVEEEKPEEVNNFLSVLTGSW